MFSSTSKGRSWTPEDINKLRILAKSGMYIDAIAIELDRSTDAIKMYTRKHNIEVNKTRRNWKADEVLELINMWQDSSVSMTMMQRKFNRSSDAIACKAYKLGLGARPIEDEYFTQKDLEAILNCTSSKIARYNAKGLKCHYNTVKSTHKYTRYYDIDEVLEFLKNNQDTFDATQIDTSYLYTIPDWLKDKIARDRAGINKERTKWTSEDDSRLKYLVNSGNTDNEIALKLGRSIEAVKIRRRLLNIGNPNRDYTTKEIKILKDYYGTLSAKQIRERYLPHRSLNSIQKKVAFLGLHSNLNGKTAKLND